MIKLLTIQNLGIIRKLQVDFSEGFNAITGESGSGKSLIAKAISLAGGARADRDTVHPEAESAVVVGVFELESPKLKKILEDMGIEANDEIIVRRIIERSGRGKVFINDSPVTLKKLQEISAYLLEIQGQRESLKLLKPEYQLSILDAFANLKDELQEYQKLYQEYGRTLENLEKLQQREAEAKREMDYLRFVVNEIEEISPAPEEEKQLNEERKILQNIELLRYIGEMAKQLLSEGENSAASLISQVIAEANRVKETSPTVSEAIGNLETALALVEDASFKLSSIAESYDFTPERLNEIEERLNAYQNLKAKYGPSTEEVLNFYEEAKKKLELLENASFEKEDLERKLVELKEKLGEKAQTLSQKRKEAASMLEELITKELKALGFDKPVFKIEFQNTEPGPQGLDKVEFMFSANPDAPALPLKKIASGGELSRVLLALKVVLSDREETNLIIFDEIDAGIGGSTASLVAERLKKLGEKRQVIAITHFPQVASAADNHLLVEKTLKGNRTFVSVRKLAGEERIRELEKMAGNIVKIGRGG